MQYNQPGIFVRDGYSSIKKLSAEKGLPLSAAELMFKIEGNCFFL